MLHFDINCFIGGSKIHTVEALTTEEAAIRSHLLRLAAQAPRSLPRHRLHHVVDVRVAKSTVSVLTDIPALAPGLRRRFHASGVCDLLPIELRLLHAPSDDASWMLLSPHRVIAAQPANDVLSFVIHDTSSNATCFANVGGFGHDPAEHCRVPEDIMLDMVQCLVEIEMLHSARIADPKLQFVHAGSVSREGKAVLLLGPSCSGKTTTALGLALLGFELLSDDTACLDLEQRMIYPYPRAPRLRPQSTALLRSCKESMRGVAITSESLPTVRTTPASLAALIFLGGFSDPPLVQRLRSDEALWLFLDYLFNHRYQPVSIRLSQHRLPDDLPRHVQGAASCFASLAAYRCLPGDLQQTAAILQHLLMP
jgi:hypothetical protein